MEKCHNDMKLPIVKVPDPILRAKAAPVKKITPELSRLAKNMLETIENDGIGLAAPQIGKGIQLIVAAYLPKDPEDKELVPYTILFNPKFKKLSAKTDKLSEGCLSLPGITGVVERSKSIRVTGQNENGANVTIDAHDLYARVLQHEIDHLNGILFIDRLQHYKVVFFGTSEFAVPSLLSLINHPQFDVVAVVTETDKPAGRGHQPTISPVKQVANKYKIPVLQPTNLNPRASHAQKAVEAIEFLSSLNNLEADFNIVVSYGKILPKEILDSSKIVSLNIHPSLLPKYRGATPIQSALLNGDKHVGTSIIIMTPKMDAGPIMTMYKHHVRQDDNFGTLHDRLALACANQLILTMETIISDKGEYYSQNDANATYTTKISHEMAEIKVSDTASVAFNKIRAFNPKPGAWVMIDDVPVKILAAHLETDKIAIDQLQLPGKKPITMNDLKNGRKEIYHKLLEQFNLPKSVSS